jgi:predicted nucleic acid-binding Zn ribbon protein
VSKDEAARRRRPGSKEAGDRTSEPEALGVVLSSLSGQRPLAAGLALGRLGRNWRSVVGERLAQECEPAQLENGILLVRVSSAAWASHLKFLSEEIRSRSNAALGGDPVREVRVVLGGGREGLPSG